MNLTFLKLTNLSLPEASTPRRVDIAVGVLMAIALGVLVYQGANLIDPYFYEKRVDAWFQGDLPYRFEMITDYTGHYAHDKSHPAFSPLGFVPTTLLRLLGLDAIHAARTVMSSLAGLWVVTMFLVLRGLGARLLDAVLFTLLGASSASFIFWYTVPETYPFGSLAYLLTLGLVLQSEQHVRSWVWFALSGAFNVGITLTNFMVAIFATLANFSWQRAIFILGAGLVLAATVAVMVILQLHPFTYIGFAIALYIAFRLCLPRIERIAGQLEGSATFQKLFRLALALAAILGIAAITVIMVIPSIRGYLVEELGQELQYIFPVFAGGPFIILRSIFAHTIVMPAPQLLINSWHPETGLLLLLTQMSAAGSGSSWGAIAVGLWMALLGLGFWGFFRSREHTKFRLVLGLSLAGQVLLHLIYGEETFLYSLHFLPLLILVAAWSVFTRARVVALVLAGLLVATLAANNIQQFESAAATLNSLPQINPYVSPSQNPPQGS
ncbi:MULTISPECIES: hypothetical protein [unclassified Leptolyngbya]|uniref:hypothetical protein n=1 Tax=unclassified Leptolyngbya TaxID=2650499 RepID=UPI001681C5E1|nr:MULTISPECIES: hypothetical protein [unclassified Leptolyngbya]MBD1909873.1 hypothetical protein [Leptolyngbya sp. FACHB-8]MBD2156969.1 hypothetical protein [Leptolyngbya sp. FACHB-16]